MSFVKRKGGLEERRELPREPGFELGAAAASLTSGPNQPRIPKSAMGAGRGKELPHIFIFPLHTGVGTTFQGSLPGRFSSRDEVHIVIIGQLGMYVLDAICFHRQIASSSRCPPAETDG